MACPPDQVLVDFARGRLSLTAAAELRKHVEGCPSCKSRIGKLLGETQRPERPGTAVQMAPPSDKSTMAGKDWAKSNEAKLKKDSNVGRYVIEAELGAGGMGVVYLAYDPGLDRKVALKLLRPDAFAGTGAAEGRARLLREAHAMAKLNHPNVVQIHDVGQFGEQVFFAMNLVEGKSLRDWLEDKPREWREILEIFIAAGRGLEAAHKVGLIHRDFKPDNVLVDGKGIVQVTDFGLAKTSATSSPPEADTDKVPVVARSTSSGPATEKNLLSAPLTVGVSGTPGYMSPEQAMGKAYDARSDQYSFCISLAEALFGPKPENAAWASPRDPKLADAVPGWVRKALQRGLEQEPSDRYPSITELLDALEDDPAVRWRRIGTVSGYVGLAAIVAGLGWYINHRRMQDICYAPERKLAGIWDDKARSALRTAFAATGFKDQADTADRVVKGLDAAAAKWVGAYKSACDDTRVAHKSDAELSYRTECLDRQRKYDFKETVDLLSHPDKGLMSSAIAVALSLPPVAECNSAFALSLVKEPDSGQADKVRDIRVKVARGRALIAAERDPDAIELLTPVVQEARETRYGPSLAEVLFTLGRAQSNIGTHDAAVYSFGQAEDAAFDAHQDELAAEASAMEAGQLIYSEDAGRKDVDGEANRAQHLTVRLGTGGLSELELVNLRVRIAALRGPTSDETNFGKQVLDLTEQLYGSTNLKTLVALQNLAQELIDDGRYPEASEVYRKAIELSERLFGARASRSKSLWAGLGYNLEELGGVQEALDAANRALEAQGDSPDDADSAQAWAVRALSLARLQKSDEARKAMNHAIGIGEQLKLSTAYEFDFVNVLVAEAAVTLGDGRLAVDAYERSLICDKAEDAANPNWVMNLRVGGQAYLAAGNAAKARDIFERALSLAPGHTFYPNWIPEIRFRLAQALLRTNGDKRRAFELTHQSREELRNLPTERALLAELDDWAAATLGKETK